MRSSIFPKHHSLIRLSLFAGSVALSILVYLFLLSLLRNYSFGGTLAAAFLTTICLVINRGFLRAEALSLASIGLEARQLRLNQFGLAFLAGTALVAIWLLIAVSVLSAHLHIARGIDRRALLGLPLFYLFNNTAEELAYRGYAFLVLEKNFGRWAASIATSVVFVLLHIQGGMPVLQAMAGTLPNSLIFAMVFSRWKCLPMSLGVHLATNVMQDVFGFRQSALTLLAWSEANFSRDNEIVVLTLVASVNLAVVVLIPLLKTQRHGEAAS